MKITLDRWQFKYYIEYRTYSSQTANRKGDNMTSEFTKQYYANIKANQIKVYCTKCKKHFYIFPENKGNTFCNCGEELK